ncbi:hypothetical protein DSCW_66060 [Desulfosarcina widdelii]|uniref:Uncharacterized protein n=1 Tax=Desulfosarcina widdelii TaxID=947919 RepID=A0A5K7ZG92_9BACT|nr:hypothetical protein [Desulfosarcina widdelii]BBO79189.1 hypothetical protein DSCW_66060 [Desulfosarcina widdelii]
MQDDRINFDGNAQNRDRAIKLLDEILKEQGDFGVYGDLSHGLTEILKANGVDIAEKKHFLEVSIYPISGQGHDFSFNIDIKEKKLIDLVVGEIEPQPEIR